MENSAIGYSEGSEPIKLTERIADELNTEKHLVRVYKIQAQCAQERNKELVEALTLAVFYLQGTGRDLSKMESLIGLKSDSK